MMEIGSNDDDMWTFLGKPLKSGAEVTISYS